MSAVDRALKAIESGKPSATTGRPPKGKLAGVKVHLRIDPHIILENDQLTGLAIDEVLILFVHACRRAKAGATDADLAYSVRSWLRKDAA